MYGQKFARGGRGGGGNDVGTFKHEGGAGADGAKMNSGDIFKKLSREVIETGLPASDVKESLHKLQVRARRVTLWRAARDVVAGRRVYPGQDLAGAVACEWRGIW